MRVLITGAAGRLGSTVAALFHREGFDVLATDVVDAGNVPYRFIAADLRDHQRVLELLDGIEVVLHIGNHPGIGHRQPQVVFNDNVSMNENVFQGAAERGASKIVFASTLQMIGSHADRRTVVTEPKTPDYPLNEHTVPDPSNVYALSKTVTEVMLRYYSERCGIDGIALRFPLLHYGDDRARVSSGSETPTDIFEGFIGLSHDDAAALFLAVVRADLPGYRMYMAGVANRHRELTGDDLIRTHYPHLVGLAHDLIDVSIIEAETGWRPSPELYWTDASPPSSATSPKEPTP